ncbi:MAG: hypothetical protein Q9M50_11785 [Methylococcales bacterium]|nr:hypothetical protein [Methylococcales bacterium]
MSPLLPTPNIAARDLWPLKIEREILKDIAQKNVEFTETENDSWLVLVEKKWQLLSLSSDLYDNNNLARQELSIAVQVQRELSERLSQQRCLVIIQTSTDDEQWRLWQVVKREETLGDSLEKVYSEKDAKKIAAMLFIVAEKFYGACKYFFEQNMNFPLTLNSLKLEDNEIIFTGFIPFKNDAFPIDIGPCFEQAFQAYITRLLNDPTIKPPLISYYLSVYAENNSENAHLINKLLKLFKR